MRLLSFLFALLLVPAALAATPLEIVTDDAGSIAQRLLTLSTQQEVPATDARVAPTQAKLTKVAKATGETEQAVAAACTRAARFLFDATRTPATPVDVLEGLAAKGGSRSLSDMVGAYVAARRNSSGRTHAEALAAMQ